MARSPRDLAFEWRDALVGRDAARFARLFAADGVLEDVEHRSADLLSVRPVAGRAAIEDLTRGWLEATPAFAYDVLEVLADERSAAVHWRYTVPDAGELEGLSWLTCAGGEIERAFVAFDSYALLQRPGVEPGGEASASELADLRRWIASLDAADLGAAEAFDVRRPEGA